MELKVYAVYDSKAEAYMQPLFFQSKGVAIRSFTEAVNDGESQLAKYPSDFTLFELGTYKQDSATFLLHSTPVSVGVGIEFVRNKEV